VAHQLLHHLHIVAGICQQRTIRPPKRVPSDLLLDPYPASGRLQDFGPQTVGPQRRLAEVMIAGEDPVLRFRVVSPTCLDVLP